MTGFWVNVRRRFDAFRYRRRIDRALALHLRGEVRSDGLKIKSLSTRLQIEWYARDVHPWDRADSPEERAARFVQHALADTEAAIIRLFGLLPEIDDIALSVLERSSGHVIMAGTVHRFVPTAEDSNLSVGMQLRRRGITYHSDGFRFEPLWGSIGEASSS